MKISILLPYKENFSPNYAGAVSLFVKDITKISKYKKVKIIVQMFFMKESLITRSRIEDVIRPYSTTHGNNIKAEKT